jgi:hypothetical protein
LRPGNLGPGEGSLHDFRIRHKRNGGWPLGSRRQNTLTIHFVYEAAEAALGSPLGVPEPELQPRRQRILRGKSQPPEWDPVIALPLPCYCLANALPMLCYCPANALLLPCYCTAIALLLPCCCPANVLLLPCCCPADPRPTEAHICPQVGR